MYNMFDGTVISVTHSGYGGGYGPNIIVQEDSGRAILYGDLSEFSSYSVGDKINATGTGSTGYHVHVEVELLTKGQSFKYGYDNSVNPCEIMGIENVIDGTEYIYDGTPIPPTPEKKKKHKFKWVLYARKLREKELF